MARFDGVGWDCQWLVKSAETRSKKSMAVWVKDRVKVIDNAKKHNVPIKSGLSFRFPQVEAPDPTGGGQEQEMAGDNQVGGWKYARTC